MSNPILESIRKRFGLVIKEEELDVIQTGRQLCAHIDSLKGEGSNSSTE